jgi:uncharacterized protein with ParB-like and HNH nuclease domain
LLACRGKAIYHFLISVAERIIFMTEQTWFQDYADDEDIAQIDEYDITSTPNDFNILTLVSFIDSGAVRIPGFQRNFVWDKKRASKLIESLIIGIPVPQLFLYEQSRNRFLVIDGQQRLMTIYYFVKKRFPRKDMRVHLREVFDSQGHYPDEILHNDIYFEDFKLLLSGDLPKSKNKFSNLNYATLSEYKTQFDLRPLRNIVVKQNSPAGDDSAMYEVFNRLNTGGVNLRPQEIRTSMYHSAFYEVLYRINNNKKWREILSKPDADLHMKDIEILLRAFAILIDGDKYAPSLVRFLNQFSRKSESNDDEKNLYCERLFESFMEATSDLTVDAFINQKNARFNVALFEAVFAASCCKALDERRLVTGKLLDANINRLAADSEFTEASIVGTTQSSNLEKRLKRAKYFIPAL